jgi:cell division protein FtsB
VIFSDSDLYRLGTTLANLYVNRKTMQNIQNISQAYSQAPWRKQVQWIGAFLLVLVFVCLIAALYLNVTARAATIGRAIQDMQVGQIETANNIPDQKDQRSIEELKQHNADLQAQLAYLLSEDTMQARAKNLGFEFVEPGTALYIEVPGYVPPQTATMSPPPGPTVSGQETQAVIVRSSLLDWVEGQFRLAEKMLK